MKLESGIRWCDVTIGGAVIGCLKVSPGCQQCYAERDTPARILRSRGIETWGPAGVRHPVAGFAEKIRRLNKLCICDRCHETFKVEFIGRVHGEVGPTRICGGGLRKIRLFADSNSDFLDDCWLIKGRADMLGEMLHTLFRYQNFDAILLTKRPENFTPRIKHIFSHYSLAACNDDFCAWLENWMAGDAPHNIWLGTSCENQEYADRRIPELLKIPAAVRFVSAEPLLGPIDLNILPRLPAFHTSPKGWMFWFGERIHQIIVGGESGPNARPCEVSWITDIADQCQAARLPVWVKQDFGKKPGQQGRIPDAYWKLKQTPCQRPERR